MKRILLAFKLKKNLKSFKVKKKKQQQQPNKNKTKQNKKEKKKHFAPEEENTLSTPNIAVNYI